MSIVRNAGHVMVTNNTSSKRLNFHYQDDRIIVEVDSRPLTRSMINSPTMSVLNISREDAKQLITSLMNLIDWE